MGKINTARVILGGLLAGVVINIGEFILNEPILGEEWKEAMQALNRPEMGGGEVVWYIIWGFITGIAMVWLYAAIRPRFGPGPKTAVIAGLTVWFLAWLLSFGGTLINDMFPTRLVIISLIWGFFELPIATLAGAWLYKEQGSAATP